MYVGSNERRTCAANVLGSASKAKAGVGGGRWRGRGKPRAPRYFASLQRTTETDDVAGINFAVTGPRRMGCNLRRAESHARHSRRCEPARVFELCQVRFERHVFAFGWSPARPDDAINLPCLSNRPTTRDVTRARPLCEHA